MIRKLLNIIENFNFGPFRLYVFIRTKISQIPLNMFKNFKFQDLSIHQNYSRLSAEELTCNRKFYLPVAILSID